MSLKSSSISIKGIDTWQMITMRNIKTQCFIRRNYQKRKILLEEFLIDKSCRHCGESEHVCLKFYPHDSEIRKISKRVGTSDESRKEVFHLIDQSDILCYNCFIKKHHDLIEFI